MAARMEYLSSESSYVGRASDGTWVRVHESEYAAAVADAMREVHGIDMNALGDWSGVDPAIKALYEQEKVRWLDADEWLYLSGDNPNAERGHADQCTPPDRPHRT